MKGKTMNLFTNLILPVFLAGIAAVIIFAALKGISLPWIASPRASLVALLVVGLTMCVLGGLGQIGSNGRWDTPLALIGILLGCVILIIIIAALAGWKLPLISGEVQAITSLAFLLGVKFILGTASYFFHWL